ncbi:Transcriptional repressor of the fructose operon, DeoR family [Alkalibacterium sp. AK22]|uniref:DeoR/GlpR family DNA-binding transcription regulator n=1 Tax=Alkalibacterium sp. AK22 TaxID=1229520 RepID=UPI000448637D|nr:DeoR/GlpR family DNA-binding transcription regulator [Alkalibacterium sp. AK22]EXJ22565.1 Transcriptional repressor of the fructose operon, DeoR family [Alkalibacterium sp. AK22]
MLTEERHRYILDLLEEKDTVSVQEITEKLNHSESTVRRDLTQLESQQKLVRVHGGAKKRRRPSEEASMEEKTVKFSHSKDRIAQFAASLVEDNDVIYVDAGSTTFAMIPYLKDRPVTVVTNGVPHASLLADLHIETILLGGKIKQRTKAIIGPLTEQSLSRMYFTKAFMGMNGISVEYGLTTPDVEEASVKERAIRQANEPYILADSSKFGEVDFVKVADVEDCVLITDHLPQSSRKLTDITKVIEVQA